MTSNSSSSKPERSSSSVSFYKDHSLVKLEGNEIPGVFLIKLGVIYKQLSAEGLLEQILRKQYNNDTDEKEEEKALYIRSLGDLRAEICESGYRQFARLVLRYPELRNIYAGIPRTEDQDLNLMVGDNIPHIFPHDVMALVPSFQFPLQVPPHEGAYSADPAQEPLLVSRSNEYVALLEDILIEVKSRDDGILAKWVVQSYLGGLSKTATAVDKELKSIQDEKIKTSRYYDNLHTKIKKSFHKYFGTEALAIMNDEAESCHWYEALRALETHVLQNRANVWNGVTNQLTNVIKPIDWNFNKFFTNIYAGFFAKSMILLNDKERAASAEFLALEINTPMKRYQACSANAGNLTDAQIVARGMPVLIPEIDRASHIASVIECYSEAVHTNPSLDQTMNQYEQQETKTIAKLKQMIQVYESQYNASSKKPKTTEEYIRQEIGNQLKRSRDHHAGATAGSTSSSSSAPKSSWREKIKGKEYCTHCYNLLKCDNPATRLTDRQFQRLISHTGKNCFFDADGSFNKEKRDQARASKTESGPAKKKVKNEQVLHSHQKSGRKIETGIHPAKASASESASEDDSN